jgi:HK97 family phage prohead protease
MRRNDLLGSRETRVLPTRWESRAASSDELTLTGYASVFDAPYDIWGGPLSGGWTETVDPKAFQRTLREKPDVHLLINHEGMPLARTKSGTLKLSTDSTGLAVEARLDRGDPDVQRLERKMTRGDMDEMSFAFRTLRDEWSALDIDGETVPEASRRLLEVSIDKGDVSVVNFGANPATSTELQRALRAIAAGDERVLAEVRSTGVDLSAVADRLTRSLRPAGPKTLSVAEALKLIAG